MSVIFIYKKQFAFNVPYVPFATEVLDFLDFKVP